VANRESKCLWPKAVMVSLLLHGVIVMGLSNLPRQQTMPIQVRAKSQPVLFMLADGDGGDIHFEEQESPVPKGASSVEKTKPDNTGPFQSVFHDPLSPVPAGNTTGPTDPGKGAQTPVGSGSAGSFFGVPAHGRRIVYVLDGSASMGKNGAFKFGCAELNASLARLPGDAKLQIIIYNSQPQNVLPRYPGWLEPTPVVLEEIRQALARQMPEGKTEHGRALRQALLLRPDVMFFLTDANDLQPEHLLMASQLNRGTIIHTIELTTQSGRRVDSPLQTLARENHGMYQAVDLEP
jgi:hypothetical protein